MADGPVIVSSNRFEDIRPYCGSIYHSEPEKWGDVLPWEFPQHAARADEEDFLRKFFSDSEIHSRGGAYGEGLGFRFLKQVWYCIALWNLDHKIPAIADEWMQHNQEIITDPTMLEHVCKDDATLQTFAFSSQQEKMYGEKLLHWVIKNIQFRVKSRVGKQDTEQQTPPAAEPAIKLPALLIDTDALRASPESVKQPEAPESAVVPPVGLEAPDTTPRFAITVPGSARLPERLPDLARTMSHPPASGPYPMNDGVYVPQPSRPRGNSNSRRYGNNNSGTSRFNSRNNQPYYNQPYYNQPWQQLPQFNAAAPSIGDVPMHSMLNPTRFASGGSPDFVPPQHYMPQMPQMHPMQGGPPPPGAYGNHMQQQFGPSYPPPPQQMPMPMAPTSFVPPQQPNPYYNAYSMMNDRSNGRHTNRSFSDNESFPHSAEEASYRHGPGKRRDSEASRGSKSRGAFASGRGRGGRGRNSFTGSGPQHEMFSGDGQFKDDYNSRKQSGQYDFARKPSFADRDRHCSTNSQSWRSGNERPRTHQDENMMLDSRVVSGPGHAPQDPMLGMTNMPPPDLDQSNRTPRDRNDRQMAMANPLYAAQQTYPQNPISDAIHNEDDPRAVAFPEKLLTKHHIGMEFGYVKKLVMFNLAPGVTDAQIRGLLSPFSTIDMISPSEGERPSRRPTFLTLESHTAARDALSLNRKATLGGVEVRIEVPKEYWDVSYARYPGQGGYPVYPQKFGYSKPAPRSGKASTIKHPDAPAPTSQKTPKQNDEDAVPSSQDEPASGNRTPIAKAPVDDKALKDLLSGETTPTASGASTPKGTGRKNKNKKSPKNKKQQRIDSRAKTTQTVSPKHEREQSVDDNADTRSDTSTATVIKTTQAKDGKLDKSDELLAAGEEVETSQPALDTERKVSDDAQTKSEPTFSPEEPTMVQFPKIHMPQGDKASADQKELQDEKKPKPELEASQSIRGFFDSEKRTADSEVVIVKPYVTEKIVNGGRDSKTESKPDRVKTIRPSMDSQTPTRDAPASQQKYDEDQTEDSFHTAHGSPPGLTNGSKEDRASEVSTATVASDATTVICAPATTDEALTPTENDASVTSPAKPQPVGATKAPASPASSSRTKATKKAPVPQLPKIKIAESTSTASKSSDKASDAEQTAQRSASGLSVPPTPAFQTAPSTPAMPSSADVKGETVEELQPTKNVDQVDKAPKAEKAKGPAQTESFSLFSKKQQPKSKKYKAVKGKVPAKDSTNVAGRSFSDATSESLSRMVSRAATPSTQADEQPTLVLPSEDDVPAVVANMTRNDSGGPSRDDAADTGADPQRDTSEEMVPEVGKPKTDVAFNTGAKPDIPTTPAEAQTGPLRKSSAVVNYVNSLFRSTQPAQPATSETKVGELSSKSTPSDSTAPSTHANQQIEQAALSKTHTDATADVVEADDKPVAPVAQMVSPADGTGSIRQTEQPFRSPQDFRDNSGLRDSGDSRGRVVDATDGVVGGDLGLGISNVGDGVMNPEDIPKKKKKKSKNKKAKKSTADGMTEESLESTPNEPSPFAFEFKANLQPTPSDEGSNTPSNNPPSISDIASTASSQTLAKSSSREQTPNSTSASVSESPARHIIAKKISQGTSHLVEPPPLRRKPKRITSSTKTSDTTTPTENESNTMYLEAQAESDDEDDKEPPAPPMLYFYVGPGKRSNDPSWEVDSSEKVEKRLEEVVERKLGSQGHDENVKPETASQRKGG